ncbi:acetyltransferase [Vibrio scophthalmi]|uniref:UDP-3-O-(3-hydroxymyristoyl)glucosamine N-acyltransferase n=1 Tax=Vibrio scophthalmi TaxID=45658 RepID=A0A1C7FD70_9VIBR|nr:acetyltransferase [Vibrio scophthalmi]ANU37667.1 UDP-3-O-(3-hydroxymyristoyl)glucosamine N-acyltransferase [Vibrio scophthalmi]
MSTNARLKCAILGASGHGKIVAEVAELNGYHSIVFFDDRWPALSCIEGWEVVGGTEDLIDTALNYDNVAVAIGCNETRLSKYSLLLEKGANCTPLVHPSAIVSRYADLGEGSVVMAGAIVNSFSRIGKACIINTSSTVDHDCIIADGVHISPGGHLAGAVQVGRASWLGIGSNVKQLIKIGSNAVVAAGATVIRDVLDNQTVVGVPAKPISCKE